MLPWCEFEQTRGWRWRVSGTRTACQHARGMRVARTGCPAVWGVVVGGPGLHVCCVGVVVVGGSGGHGAYSVRPAQTWLNPKTFWAFFMDYRLI
jgi:hypothetical protein